MLESCDAANNKSGPTNCVARLTDTKKEIIPMVYQINVSKDIRTLTLNVPGPFSSTTPLATGLQQTLLGGYTVTELSDNRLVLYREQENFAPNGTKTVSTREIRFNR